MGKNGFLTPKAIANRIKAKGLQRLRWYCQVCQKQCRDENGFKCHQMSESHKRQLEIFGQDPGRFVNGYSEEFESAFMDHLKRAHPHTRISANVVYNEYIADRHHVHMNSTKWLTLTEFVKYLGKTGQCKVEETSKGWFIQVIHRDEMHEIADGKKRKRDEAEQEDDLRQFREIEKQIKRAEKTVKGGEEGVAGGTDLNREEGDQPVAFSVSSRKNGGKEAEGKLEGSYGETGGFGGEDNEEWVVNGNIGKSGGKKGLSKLEAMMQAELAQKAKEKSTKVDGWLQKGIVVKVLAKELKEHGYYKKKGVVVDVVGTYMAEISMMESGDVVRVDQAQLETVLPQSGSAVLILNGVHRGKAAVLLGLNTEQFQAQVKISKGMFKGEKLWLDYEDVSKLDKDFAV